MEKKAGEGIAVKKCMSRLMIRLRQVQDQTQGDEVEEFRTERGLTCLARGCYQMTVTVLNTSFSFNPHKYRQQGTSCQQLFSVQEPEDQRGQVHLPKIMQLEGSRIGIRMQAIQHLTHNPSTIQEIGSQVLYQVLTPLNWQWLLEVQC